MVHGNYKNFEPRIGIAWQPKFLKPKTVVRAGYSIFYNESIYNTLARELAYQPPVSTAQTLTTTSTQPLTFRNGFQTEQRNWFHFQYAVDRSFLQEWLRANVESRNGNVAFGQWLLDLTYTGTKGTDLDILRAPNRAPLGTPSDEIQAHRIDNNATGFTFDQSGANSIYNALQVRLMHRFTHGFILQGIYTYGKSLDDASSIGGSGGTVEQQDGNLHAEYGLSTFDVRHQFRANVDVGAAVRPANPLGESRMEEKAFGDWRLQNIFTWQTGTPFTVLLGGVASDNGTGANFSLRPDITGNPNKVFAAARRPRTSIPTSSPAHRREWKSHLRQRGAWRRRRPVQLQLESVLSKAYRFGPERRHQMNVEWQIQNLTNTANFNGIGTVLPCGPGVSVSGIVCGVSGTDNAVVLRPRDERRLNAYR